MNLVPTVVHISHTLRVSFVVPVLKAIVDSTMRKFLFGTSLSLSEAVFPDFDTTFGPNKAVSNGLSAISMDSVDLRGTMASLFSDVAQPQSGGMFGRSHWFRNGNTGTASPLAPDATPIHLNRNNKVIPKVLTAHSHRQMLDTTSEVSLNTSTLSKSQSSSQSESQSNFNNAVEVSTEAASTTSVRIEYFFTSIFWRIPGAQFSTLVALVLFIIFFSFKLAVAGYHFSDPERQLRYVQLHRSLQRQQTLHGKGEIPSTKSLESLGFEAVARGRTAPQEVIFPAINYRINFDTLPRFAKSFLCPI